MQSDKTELRLDEDQELLVRYEDGEWIASVVPVRGAVGGCEARCGETPQEAIDGLASDLERTRAKATPPGMTVGDEFCRQLTQSLTKAIDDIPTKSFNRP